MMRSSILVTPASCAIAPVPTPTYLLEPLLERVLVLNEQVRAAVVCVDEERVEFLKNDQDPQVSLCNDALPPCDPWLTLPASSEPTRCAMLHTSAPPSVAR